MRKWLFGPMLLLLVSCEYFLSQEERTHRLVKEELSSIDWNDVDQYPLFDECDETASKNVQRACFKEIMLQRFSDTLSSLQLSLDNDLHDTIRVDFLIDEHGFITILEIQEKQDLEILLPGFKEEVGKRLNDLTTVAPAIKRGIPVSIKFRLPIILNTSN